MPKKSTTRHSKKSSPAKQLDVRKSGREKGSGSVSGKQQKIQGTRKAEGQAGKIGNISAKGCLPKLSVVLLPLIAVGTYLIFKS